MTGLAGGELTPVSTATYQSSPEIATAFRLGRVPHFVLVIADEAHRCAGRVSSDFATILDAEAIQAHRRLFMTATPRYFTGRVVREAKEADFEIASMDDQAKFGPVFHRLGFAEAIERDLLTDYKVVVVGADDATYLDWAQRGRFITLDGTEVTDARTLAGQIGLAKAMRRYDLHRTITFHSRIKRAREFARSLQRSRDDADRHCDPASVSSCCRCSQLGRSVRCIAEARAGAALARPSADVDPAGIRPTVAATRSPLDWQIADWRRLVIVR
jgi:predicted helicase